MLPGVQLDTDNNDYLPTTIVPPCMDVWMDGGIYGWMDGWMY